MGDLLKGFGGNNAAGLSCFYAGHLNLLVTLREDTKLDEPFI